MHLLTGCRMRIFQSTPSVWRETGNLFDLVHNIVISIHSLRMEGDRFSSVFLDGKGISIHSLRMEGDFFSLLPHLRRRHFNPLPPYGGRHTHAPPETARTYFNPLPPYGGRQKFKGSGLRYFYFNPLPPYGGRQYLCFALRFFADFNPLPPYGGRLCHLLPILSHLLFQSTPSVWRETPNTIMNEFIKELFQSTPSVWRETYDPYIKYKLRTISIHSLRMEGDVRSHFLHPFRCISIHSLRMEGDRHGLPWNIRQIHFNPLPPYGGRHRIFYRNTICISISIHSLRMEGDRE